MPARTGRHGTNPDGRDGVEVGVKTGRGRGEVLRNGVMINTRGREPLASGGK